jgi:hypothetical protein
MLGRCASRDVQHVENHGRGVDHAQCFLDCFSDTCTDMTRLSGRAIVRAASWAGAGFAISGAAYSLMFLIDAFVQGEHAPSLEASVGIVAYGLFLWLLFAPLTLSTLVVTTLAWASTCRKLNRGDGKRWAIAISAVCIGLVVMAVELFTLEHRTVTHSWHAVFQAYYAKKWLALSCGLFLSRIAMGALGPGCFYRHSF